MSSLPSLPAHTVKIQRDGRTLVHGTVVGENEILTKLSMLGEITDLSARHQDYSAKVTLLAKDEKYDVALLKCEGLKLDPAVLHLREPRVGSLVISPGENGPLLGCITQPIRSSPKAGYEHNAVQNVPTGWLGISFAPGSTSLTIAAVEVGSPADAAGLLEGDQLVKFGDNELTSQDDLFRAISPKAPGEKITLKILRGEKDFTFKPILGIRPTPKKNIFQQSSSMRDDALKSLSKKGGPLSKRRLGFPLALYHDLIISPEQAGTPLFDLKGRVIGINISRAYRHRSLAIPSKAIDNLLWKLR